MFTIKRFLGEEVTPALGCTEPGAVALAAARAAEELNGDVRRIDVVVSKSIFKNGNDVGIPGAGGSRGNIIAAAMGAVCGDASQGLQVLKACTQEGTEQAREMVRRGAVSVRCDHDRSGVFVDVAVTAGEHRASCRIEGSHNNIIMVRLDDRTTYEQAPAEESGKDGQPAHLQIAGMDFAEIWELSGGLDDEDVETLLEGYAMNRGVAEFGFSEENPSAVALGRRYMEQIMQQEAGVSSAPDGGRQIRAYCAAASDARMAGVERPVMSSAGSGNHGITAILPVGLLGEQLGASERETAEALALSHLATSFVKSNIGRLSPVCGCAVAAGSGAAAGMARLLGGDRHQAEEAMKLVLGNIAGLVCDGAKESCAFKVATAAYEAYVAAALAVQGMALSGDQGLVNHDIGTTAKNVGRLNQEGMRDADEVMLDIMQRRHPG